MNKIELALTIRAVENKFLELFNKGKLNGTVHTCVGQEFSGIAFCSDLKKNDFVFSNHRCHGHYIAFTKEYEKLIAELMGKNVGVCAGIGGSQHLYTGNFFSNGPQGALASVAVGVSLANKKQKNGNIVICFIGDGTLGEGIIYESMNLASLYEVPILFVCENNRYAQSTSINDNLAGTIIERARAFDLDVYEGDTWNYEKLFEDANSAIENTRLNKPGMFIVETYRLNAHSKGDDDRNIQEINKFRKDDPINRLLKNNSKLQNINKKILNEIDQSVVKLTENNEIEFSDYVEQKKYDDILWEKFEIIKKGKVVDQIYKYFKQSINADDKVLMIGEDIAFPYGGAFKVTKDLSKIYPNNIISTPISEAGVVGLGIGLAINGYKPFVEIMFGDFISYAFDQILSNASKFYSMFNKQINVPLNIRTPMGGGRGYGPTHSQSLEKHFIGLNNIEIIALNTLVDIFDIYETISKSKNTNIIIENKLDYGRLETVLPKIVEYVFFKSNTKYQIIIGKPKDYNPQISIITYGGSIHPSLEVMDKIFIEHELFTQIVVLTKIYPLQIDYIADSVKESDYIITVEEGSTEGGFGSEIIASLIEKDSMQKKKLIRVGSENISIPSIKNLEKECLVNSEKILRKIGDCL